MPFNPHLDALLALFLIVMLILLLGRVAGRVRLPFAIAGAPRSGRLSMQAALAVDAKRRVVIVRCDGRDALLLLGPAGDLLIGWLDGGQS